MTTAERAARPPMTSAREVPFRLTTRDGGPGVGTPEAEAPEGLILDGWGAVFNRETVIDSEEGRFREVIAPGAMRRSFRETPPKIQYDHGRHPMIGSIPIAELRSAEEDVDPVLAPEGGAHIVAWIFDNWLTQPVRDAIVGGGITGMSFRFSVVREKWTYADGTPIRDEKALIDELRRVMLENVPDEELPIRTLVELKVPEIGPVAWPAYEATSVSVRSQTIDLARLHEPEQRRLLASAVLLADLAERDGADAQQATTSVGERPSAVTDAQQASKQLGARPSQSLNRNRLMLRQQRDVLIAMKKKGSR